MTITAGDLADFNQYSDTAEQMVSLEDYFVKTQTYWDFRDRVFKVLAARQARLKAGKHELKGAALIGPAGAGKSRIVKEIIQEYHALTEVCGRQEFGAQIVSVIVPGRASVKDTLKEILRALGYPVKSNRDEDYLTQRVMFFMKKMGVAALHLDEVQDSGRYKTSDSVEVFSKRFRNLMQDREWPVCLIMTATPEGKMLINHDPTLTRRLRPVEMKPMSFKNDSIVLRKALAELFKTAGILDAGLLAQDEFIKILIHASVGRFGVAMEMAIEAIGECLDEKSREIDMGFFADAYSERMDCDEELNPFVAENWSAIDTGTALQRYEEERRKRRRPKSS